MIKKNNMQMTVMSFAIGLSLLTGCGAQAVGTTNSTSSSVETQPLSTIIQTQQEGISVEYDEDDYYTEWNANEVTTITLGSSTKVEGTGVSIDGSTVTIKNGGTYVLSGTLSDGQIIVDSESKDTVRIVLNGANITSLNSAPIYVKAAGKVVISLEEGTTNTLTDSDNYALEEGSDEPDATLFSKDDLTINGAGTLNINANYGDGITSKDSLKIMEGTLVIKSADDAIKGKDMVAVKDGSITIESTGDGIKSTNSSDAAKGFIYIEGGSFNITAVEGDAFQAETDLEILDGEFNLTTGGGSANGPSHAEAFMGGGMKGNDGTRADRTGQAPSDAGTIRPSDAGMTAPSDAGTTRPSDAGTTRPSDVGMTAPSDAGMTRPSDAGMTAPSDAGAASQNNMGSTITTEEETVSTKAIKATDTITISGGNFTIDAADDGIHSNNIVNINGGVMTIATGDDGIHADVALNINAGNINITKSYEGLEAATITIAGGTTYVVASDDGINVADGTSSEDAMGDPRHSSGTAQLIINGGYLYVDASGDGLDANGSITMNGGTVIVNGPTNGGNGALDYDNGCNVNGGTFITAGSIGMAQSPSTSSTQNSVTVSFTEAQEVGQTVAILDENGKAIMAFAPSKTFQTVTLCSNQFETGKTYTYVYGGTIEGKATDGLTENATYTGGTTVSDFTISETCTYLNESGVTTQASGMGNHGGNMQGGRGQRKQETQNESTTTAVAQA